MDNMMMLEPVCYRCGEIYEECICSKFEKLKEEVKNNTEEYYFNDSDISYE